MWKSMVRRVALGLGALLAVTGVGIFLIGHEVLKNLLAYAVDDQAKVKEMGEGAFKAFGGGVFLAALGAGLLAMALPRPRGQCGEVRKQP
jgi:hypothetical protein